MSGERVILTLFAQVALILALTRISGWIFSRFRQPQILGEMLAGIILGPSLLGWAAPQFYQQLFPQESLQFLAILAQIGAVFFVFLIGLQLDPALVRTGGKSAAAIALSSILFSFGLALLVTVLSFSWSTALFIATALTASSFPVLGRILSERNLHRLQIGPISIAAAALSNLVTWAVVAAVIVIAHLSSRTLIAVAIYFATLALLIRPFLNRLLLIHEQRGKLGHNVLAAIFFLLVLSSLTAHRIGLHAFFGALILGLLMPKNPKFIRHLSEKLQDLTHVFLLPVFLAYIGLNTNVALINRPQMWGLSLLILAIACIGKIGGTVFAARLSNIPWRDSTAVGVLLNTRGLMLVFIISIGLELQLIPPAIFAILVLIGLTTTAMTTPLLNSLYPAQSLAPEQSSKPSGFSILIPISLPKSGGPLVQIADALIGPARQIGKLLALHLRRPNENESFHAPDAAESEALIPLLSQAQARSV
ncbi:MAG TPA: cation:proton antiporter, partial [Tepidisphaeraceae bacterium]|nr:cation:proton antiporter [Tepidisphaeraceae bacterium]